MERINKREVQLTDAEQIVKSWHDSLLDKGLDPVQALDEITGNTGDRNPLLTETLKDIGFRRWLMF